MTSPGHQKQQFMQKPHRSGGREFLKEFLKENLKYPKEALENSIQGDVIVGFNVNQFGEILNAQIVKGIGSGCDEEALRLVNLLKYQEVKNRGVRVTTSNRLKIPFRLNEVKTSVNIVYSTTESSKQPTQKQNVQKPKSSESYTITINLP